MTEIGVVDVLILIGLVIALVGGWSRGFFRSIGSIVGLAAGGVAAFFLVPMVTGWVGDSALRPAAVIGTVLVLLAAGTTLGTLLGSALRSGAEKAKLGTIDRLAGALVSVVVAALVWVTVASGVALIGIPGLSTAVAGSSVTRVLDGFTPEPVRGFLAEARAAVLDTGTSWIVQARGGPTTSPDAPTTATDGDAVTAATESVVRVSGVASACGVGVTGSGFVIAPDRIVTNAHVIAGVDEPVVEAPGELPVTGRVVYVDAAADLAVVATDGLDTPALTLDDVVDSGDEAVVVGYPFGGPMTREPASVVSDGVISLDNEGTLVTREVLTLAADVNQGNSGGPVLSLEGTVSGVVFGKSADVGGVGYAVPLAVLAPVAASAPSLDGPVFPGSCTSR